MSNSRTPGPLRHDVHLANAHGRLWCDVGCRHGHTPGPIRVAEKPEEDFIMDDEAMEFLEQKLLKLYQTLERIDRIDLKVNGTVAIGAVREKGKPGKPLYVYTTANNGGSVAFHKTAHEKLNLIWWDGDAGVAETRQGPARNYPPNSPPPPGIGGIQHAEQLMIGFAEDNDYVIDGMVVSRFLCKDCQRVIEGVKGGKIKVTVILDPDRKLPNPRAENWKRKMAKAAQEAAQKETGGEPDSQAAQSPTDKDKANDVIYMREVHNAEVDIRSKYVDEPEMQEKRLKEAKEWVKKIKNEAYRKRAEEDLKQTENAYMHKKKK
jgi:hypothetical protein